MKQMMLACLIALISFTLYGVVYGQETVTFPSKDGLLISADRYIKHADKKTPFIVLFHQAGWSRGEYREIAPVLNDLGFNCMAVDQRSGGEVNGVQNETAKRAEAEHKKVSYVDALPDLEAALEYARKHDAQGKLIAWGSSYSASLVIKLAGDRPGLIDRVVAFAPGEYFDRLGQSATWIQESAKNVKIPVFITSAQNEKEHWQAIFDAIPSQQKTSYLPKTPGNHGSRALWKKFSDHEGYWQALKSFLNSGG